VKFHITEDKELASVIKEGLERNDGYCPCVFKSRGKEEYKCQCKDFRENVPVGASCHCGLYIKDEQ
jgi:ferredoxin-thioredoxin reductase catalytic subunit